MDWAAMGAKMGGSGGGSAGGGGGGGGGKKWWDSYFDYDMQKQQEGEQAEAGAQGGPPKYATEDGAKRAAEEGAKKAAYEQAYGRPIEDQDWQKIQSVNRKMVVTGGGKPNREYGVDFNKSPQPGVEAISKYYGGDSAPMQTADQRFMNTGAGERDYGFEGQIPANPGAKLQLGVGTDTKRFAGFEQPGNSGTKITQGMTGGMNSAEQPGYYDVGPGQMAAAQPAKQAPPWAQTAQNDSAQLDKAGNSAISAMGPMPKPAPYAYGKPQSPPGQITEENAQMYSNKLDTLEKQAMPKPKPTPGSITVDNAKMYSDKLDALGKKASFGKALQKKKAGA